MALLEGILAHALEAPASTALLWYDPLEPKELQAWSYQQVWEAASKAASRLSDAAKIRPATHVGLMNTGAALPVLQLAILLASLVMIPLGAEPLPRLALILEDAGPLLAIIAGAKEMDLAQQLAELEGCLLMRNSDLCSMQQDPPAISLRSFAPDAVNVSHIFFTSGSTGRPKGCVCSFGNLLSYCKAKNEIHQVEEDSVVFVASAHTFDPSLGDFFATWLAGACIALAPLDFPLGRCLEATSATHVQATPAHFATVEAGRTLALRTVALGGELMPQQIVDDWAGRVRLLNTYGVTECTVYQAAAVLSPQSSRRELGNPFPGLGLFLAAKKGDDPCDCVQDGSGEIGELWIAGQQVGLGYLRRPELTEERFRDVPKMGRCFRSGDLAVAKDTARDGGRGWHLLGRRDGMVKLRGRRVELGEIEEVILAAAPDLLVSAAAVLAEKLLLLYCVLRGDLSEAVQKVTCSFLRRQCEERLPQHMVPARVLAIDELPQTSSGKVSRRQLAQLPLPLENVALAPAVCTGAAEIVASAWREVLGVAVKTNRSNFLALGGDSMAALRVCQLLATRCGAKTGNFGEELPEPLLPVHLLNRPCLADFLQHLQRSQASLGALLAEQEVADKDVAQDEMDDPEICEELSTDVEILQHAAGLGAIGVVQCFLKAQGSQTPATLGELGTRTPLHAACMNGQVEVAKLLLEARVSPISSDGKGVQPLHLAAQGSVEVLQLLLSARAKLDATTHDKQTALHFAARSGASGAMVDELLQPASTRKGKGKGGPSASPALKVDVRDSWGRTPLHWAVVNGHRSMVVKLLHEGADRTLSDHLGETALAVAERRAQCRAQDRPAEMGASVFGDIATLLGGSASTAKS